ncbi:MAG: class I SAM-dependent methyltransferase [Candidatus Bathyarchaeota archaeon]|nr:class I SAM-dependent methyltransferase [Candidatus Bathyarchaeota archaeon]
MNRITTMGTYITDLEMHFIFSSNHLKAGGLVVDVGANAGRFSIPAAEVARVVAIDLDLHALKRLRLQNQDVDVVVADARFIPIRDYVADNVVMIELLDCVIGSEEPISECSRVLKKDGVFFLSFGNKSSLKGKLKSFLGKPYLHSYKEILAVLKAEKFKSVRKLGFNWLPFDRISNSPLVPLLAKGERFLGLRRIVRFSPWVIIQAVKVGG